MRLAFAASRLNRLIASASFTAPGFITFTALLRPIFTCSARYTRPMPPSPSFFSTRYRSAMMVPIRSVPPSSDLSAEPSRGQNRSSAGYSVPQVGQIFGPDTLDALDAEDLVADEDAEPRLQQAIAMDGEGDAIPAARVVNEEFGVLAADLRVATTHRRIVRKDPVSGFAADEHRARRR